MDIKIGVAHHREFYQFTNDIFFPIQVGRSLSDRYLDMIGDDGGDNISSKNGFYCELTATYWMWKNLKSADYIGLCHYRRYFSPKENRLYFFIKKLKSIFFINKYESGAFYCKAKPISSVDIMDGLLENFSEFLRKDIDKRKVDIYALSPVKMLNINLHTHFSKPVGSFPIDLLVDIIKDLKPEYSKSLGEVLSGQKLFYANMVIMSRIYFSEYCEFIFEVLQEHELRIVSSGWCQNPSVEGCYSRLSGYLGELLTSCFISYQISKGVNVDFLPSYFLND